MGSAIAKSLHKNNFSVLVSQHHNPRLRGIPWTRSNHEAAKKSDIIFIAVKPGIVQSVLQEIAPALRPSHILISITAGITLKKLQKWSGGHKKIVRVMPNLAAQVSESASLWKATNGFSTKEKKAVKNLLNTFGKSAEAKNENMISMAGAVTGCGPAYVAAFLETLADFIEKSGFPKETARMLAIETVDGTLDYLKETGADFGALAKAVQTKGGVTEAAFKVLKKHNWQKNLTKALFAAYKKTKQLAGK